jgi:uncharacterized protein
MSDRNSGWDLSNRVFALLTVLAVGLVLFWVFRMMEIWNTVSGGYPREISVDAEGSAYIVPDTVVVQLGVTTDGETSEGVVTENTKKMNAVLEAVKAMGIEESQIKTVDYYLNPKYSWDKDGVQHTDGYTLDQSIEVRLTDFAKIGELIGAANEAGANTVGGVEFTVENPEAAKAEARSEAIAQAKEKAEQIAEASGLKLGDLVSYYEYANSDDYTSYYSLSDDRVEGSMNAAPEIHAGKEEVSLTVTLSYQLR